MNNEPEEWRAVVGWEGFYEVSSLGRVRSLARQVPVPRGLRTVNPRILNSSHLKTGYPWVQFSGRGMQRGFRVHALVAAAFLGERPPEHQIAHFDGDRTNNRVTNLRWATAKENSADTDRHGRLQRGETAVVSILNDAAVHEIRHGAGLTKAKLAAKFGVSIAAIAAVRARRNWRHLK